MKIDFKKFKVAVCFSGQLRSFGDSYSIIKRNLINCFESPDVFVTTWDNDPNIIDSKFFYSLSNNVTIKYIPVADHKPLTDNITNVFPRSCKLNILNQLFLLRECNTLKRNAEEVNNFKYDLVFRCRPDVVYQSSLNSYNFELLKFLDKTHLSDNIDDMNKLFCIVGEPEHWPQDLKSIIMNDYIKPIDDIIYFGSSEKMNIVCERYDYLEEYSKKSHTLHPELFLGYTAFTKIKKESIYRVGYPRTIIR